MSTEIQFLSPETLRIAIENVRLALCSAICLAGLGAGGLAFTILKAIGENHGDVEIGADLLKTQL